MSTETRRLRNACLALMALMAAVGVLAFVVGPAEYGVIAFVIVAFSAGYMLGVADQ